MVRITKKHGIKPLGWAGSVLCFCALVIAGHSVSSPNNQPVAEIPRVWDEAALHEMEVPLADPSASPVFAPSSYYERIPTLRLFKGHPVYAAGHEPSGYLESLRQSEPEVLFEGPPPTTEDGWIRMGEAVFDAPFVFEQFVRTEDIRSPDFVARTGIPIAKDGSLPYLRYVVRERGKVELGVLSCAMCHTRVMPDGTVIKGAQGNFPFDRAQAFSARRMRVPSEALRAGGLSLFSAPWLKPDPAEPLSSMPAEGILKLLDAIPPGVLARQGSSPFSPPKIPDLIGIKDRKYLDATGLVRHRSIGDLMRYAALNQHMDFSSKYAGFMPDGEPRDPTEETRYSDAQLYALGVYLYSLKPPQNPNPFDDVAARGKAVFESEGCVRCHTPPLYTNNKLTPVEGFEPPEWHAKKFDVLTRGVGTDPFLATKTRRGTGYYKVPSLKGLWYRGPLQHNGAAATLKDWFDPHRLDLDYVPTGFGGEKTGPVKGHPFGLDLSPSDRDALIKFLLTL